MKVMLLFLNDVVTGTEVFEAHSVIAADVVVAHVVVAHVE